MSTITIGVMGASENKFEISRRSLEDGFPPASERTDILPEKVDRRTVFTVTDEYFQTIVDKGYKNGFMCSVEEIMKIKTTMGSIADGCTVDDFKFKEDVKCEGCNRQINFFDVFLQAVGHHGIKFLKWAMFSQYKRVQMFPKDMPNVLICSNCGTRSVKLGYYHYRGNSYLCQ